VPTRLVCTPMAGRAALVPVVAGAPSVGDPEEPEPSVGVAAPSVPVVAGVVAKLGIGEAEYEE
jgi:hypothetical protein